MKITKLTTQERNVERVNMFLDNVFACGLSLNTVAKFNLYVGKDINEQEYAEILHHDLTERVFNRAVTYLTKSVKSEEQIRTYLS